MRAESFAASFIWKLAIACTGALAVAVRLGAGTGSFDSTGLHYFSTLICAAAAIYWLVDAFYLLARRGEDGSRAVLEPSLKYAITMCLAVVCTASHFLLKLGPASGQPADSAFLLIHYAVPAMAGADWLLFDPKGLMHAYGPAIWTFPLLVYLLVCELLVAGTGADLGGDFAVSGVGRFPYPVLDATVRDPLHVLCLVALGYLFFTAAGYAVFAVDRLLAAVADGRAAAEAPEDAPDADAVHPPLSAAPRHFR